jgi:protein-tyrosine-phosphatase
MAEEILRSKIKQRKIKWWDVLSCGTNADVCGTISPNSAVALNEIGISVENFKPRQLTQKLIETSEIVVTMTTMQKQMLEGCGNIVCISDICGYEIPDPYGCDLEIYRKTLQAISIACDDIINKIILT